KVRALDTTERDLEPGLPVVRVRFERDSLAVALPGAEHTRTTCSTGDVRRADNHVIAVADGLPEGAHRAVRRAVRRARHRLHGDPDAPTARLVGDDLGKLSGQLLLVLGPDRASHPLPDVAELRAARPEVEQADIRIEPL